MGGLAASWVFYPSFYSQAAATDVDKENSDDMNDKETAAAKLMQATFRQRKALAARQAAAVKLQRAVRTRTARTSWEEPLTTLVLERTSPNEMQWREDKAGPVAASPPNSASAKLSTKHGIKLAIAVPSFAALMIACLVPVAKTVRPSRSEVDGPVSGVVGLLAKIGADRQEGPIASPAIVKHARVASMPLFSLGTLLNNGSAPKEEPQKEWLAPSMPPLSPTALAGAALAALVTDKASILLMPTMEAVKNGSAALARASVEVLDHARRIIKALIKRARQWGKAARVAVPFAAA